MSPSLVLRSKCHRSTFCLYRIWKLTFIASYLGNLTFPKVVTILFLNTLSQTNNLLPFSLKSVLLYFSTLYNLNSYLCPLKPHNFKSMCRISKIITFLESLRQAGWFDLFESNIQALLIFDPLITLWGNFDAPYLKLLNDASVASACFYVRTCRRVRNSKKIATIRDFHLPGSFLCLSTRLASVTTTPSIKYTNSRKLDLFIETNVFGQIVFLLILPKLYVPTKFKTLIVM